MLLFVKGLQGGVVVVDAALIAAWVRFYGSERLIMRYCARLAILPSFWTCWLVVETYGVGENVMYVFFWS